MRKTNPTVPLTVPRFWNVRSSRFQRQLCVWASLPLPSVGSAEPGMWTVMLVELCFSVFMISWTTFLRLGMWKNINVPRNARKEFPAVRPSRGLFPKDTAIFGFWFQESSCYRRRPSQLWLLRTEGLKGPHEEKRMGHQASETWSENLARADEGRSVWEWERSRCFRGHQTAGLEKQQR